MDAKQGYIIEKQNGHRSVRSVYIRVCAFLKLPRGAEHAEVALVAPLSVLLSGGEELVSLFRELLCYGSEA